MEPPQRGAAVSRLGICASHRIAWPSPQECAALGARIIRTVCYDAGELAGAAESLIGAAAVCALIETQTNGVGNPFSDGDWTGAVALADLVARIPNVRYVEMFNELDLWGVPVEQAAHAALVMAPIIARHGKQPILTSVVSATWQEYVQRLADLLPAEIRALVWGNCHPYGRRALGVPEWFGWGASGWEAEAAYALARVYELTGLPTVATESGIKLSDANHDNDDVEDIGDDEAQATFVGNWVRSFRDLDPVLFPFACYFSWADIVGQAGEQGEFAFGLRDRNWAPRPSWSVFAEAAGEQPAPQPVPEPAVPHFVQGFATVHAAHPDLVGDPLEDERGGIVGLSQQRTRNGLLTWANLKGGQAITFYEWKAKRRWVWNGSRLVESAA